MSFLPSGPNRDTGTARFSGNAVALLSFPESRSSLWDSSPTGELLRLQLCSPRKPQLVLMEKALRLAQHHVRHCNKPRLHGFFLGSLSVDSDEEGVAVTLDRFDPGRDQGGSSSRVPSAVLPGDVVVPFTFHTQMDVSPETAIQSEAELHHSFKALQLHVSSRQTLDLSQLIKVKGRVVCSQQLDAAAFSLSWSAVCPGVVVEAHPVQPVPIIPTALVRSLTSLKQPLLSHTASRQRGFLTMNQTRKLLLILESDPKASSLPLVGLWLSGVTHVYNPQVWACCLRFLFSSALQDRVLLESSSFLLLVFSNTHRVPQFYQCRPRTGQGLPQLDYQLLTAAESTTMYQVAAAEGQALRFHFGSDSCHRQAAVFREARTSFSSAPPPAAGLSISDQDSGVEDEDLSPRPSPSPHLLVQQVKRVQPSVPELSLLVDSVCTPPNQDCVPAHTPRPAGTACIVPADTKSAPLAGQKNSAAPRPAPLHLHSTPNSNLDQLCTCCSTPSYDCTPILCSPGLHPPAPPQAAPSHHYTLPSDLQPVPPPPAYSHPHSPCCNRDPVPPRAPSPHQPAPPSSCHTALSSFSHQNPPLPFHHHTPPSIHPAPPSAPSPKHHPSPPSIHPAPPSAPSPKHHPSPPSIHPAPPSAPSPKHHPSPPSIHPAPPSAPSPKHHPSPLSIHPAPPSAPSPKHHPSPPSIHPAPPSAPSPKHHPSPPSIHPAPPSAPSPKHHPSPPSNLHSASCLVSSHPVPVQRGNSSTPSLRDSQSLPPHQTHPSGTVADSTAPLCFHHTSCLQASVGVGPSDAYQLLLQQDQQLRLLQAQVQMLLQVQGKLQVSSRQVEAQTPRSTASIAVGTGASLFWGDYVNPLPCQEEQDPPPSSPGPLSSAKRPSASSSSTSSNSDPVVSAKPGGRADSVLSVQEAPCSPSGQHSGLQSPVLGESASMYEPAEDQQRFYRELMSQLTSRLQESHSKQEEEESTSRRVSVGSDPPSSSSSSRRKQQSSRGDPVVSATLRRLRQLGVDVDEHLCDDNRSQRRTVASTSTLARINPAAVLSRLSAPEPAGGAPSLPECSADLSLEANAIALRYLSDSQLCRLSLGGHAPRLSAASSTDSLLYPSNMSLASRRYMRRYGLIEEQSSEDEEDEDEVAVQKAPSRQLPTEALNRKLLPQGQLIRDLKPKTRLLAGDAKPRGSDKENRSPQLQSLGRTRTGQPEGSVGNILDLSRLRQLPKLF